MNHLTLFEIADRLAPLMLGFLVYGFWYARVNHVLRLREPLLWLIGLSILDGLTLLPNISNDWVHFLQSRLVVLPYIYLALVVCDSLYRHMFPSRVTWHAVMSFQAIKSHTFRLGLGIAFFAAGILATVETNLGVFVSFDVFNLGIILSSLVHVLVFHAVLLLVCGVHFRTQWLVVAIASGFFTSLTLWPDISLLSVGVMSSVLMSALFWYFGLWPTLLCQICRTLVMQGQAYQTEMSIILVIILLMMVCAHFFTKPTYLSIGAFSHNKFPVTTIQQGLIVWDIPRWVLVGSICILALALKLSEKTIDLVADSLQTNYATVIEKSKTILMEREVEQKDTQFFARRFPVHLDEMSAIGHAFPNDWQVLTPAFIAWGCWQVIADMPKQKDKKVYEMVICEGPRWNQFFKHSTKVNKAKITERSVAIASAMHAIQDDLNIPPQSLMFTYAKSDPSWPKDSRWQVRYDIKDYLIANDIGLYAEVTWSDGREEAVHFRLDVPEKEKRVWAILNYLKVPEIPLMMVIATSLILAYIFGRKLQEFLQPTAQSMIGFFVLAGGFCAYYVQVLLERHMDLLLAHPDKIVLWYQLPIALILVMTFIAWVGLRGAYEIISSQPALSSKGYVVAGAFGAMVWIMQMLLGSYFNDQSIEILKMWPSFLFDPRWQFPAISMLSILVLTLVVTVWSFLLVNSRVWQKCAFYIMIVLTVMNYCITPLQAAMVFIWPIVAQGPFFYLIRRLGLRSIVPMVSVPCLFWVSWILPTSRADVFMGGVLTACMLGGMLIFWHILERKRQVKLI